MFLELAFSAEAGVRSHLRPDWGRPVSTLIGLLAGLGSSLDVGCSDTSLPNKPLNSPVPGRWKLMGSIPAGLNNYRRDLQYLTRSSTPHLPPTGRQRRLITQVHDWQEARAPGNYQNLWHLLIIYLSCRLFWNELEFFFPMEFKLSFFFLTNYLKELPTFEKSIMSPL